MFISAKTESIRPARLAIDLSPFGERMIPCPPAPRNSKLARGQLWVKKPNVSKEQTSIAAFRDVHVVLAD
jgi:hypothetical protein